MKSYLKNFFPRYHLRYIRTLVYMLQASEYHTGDFLRWFARTRDFLHVEERKQLVKTIKARVFLGFGYLFAIFLCVLALWVLIVGTLWWKYPLFFLMALFAPYLISYSLVAFLFVLRLVQWPIEYVMTASAKKKLRAHRGLKIAIAGSFGKTSMREILKTVLGVGKKVSAPPGSYNTPLGISSFVKTLKGDEEVLLFEMGEYYPGDIKRLCDLVEPDMGVITGVNEAHLEKFKDISRTQKTIFELADYLASVIGAKAGIQQGLLYVNGENELAKKYAREDVILYSRSGAGEWKVEKTDTDLSGTSLVIQKGSEKISAHSNLLGLHQVGPLVVAADIASKLGLTSAQIEQGISETKPFAHRLEPKTDAHGVTTLDDSYNGNPDGVRAVIEFLSSLNGSRRFYVTPGLVEMGAKKEEIHKEIGRELARAGIEKVVLLRNSVTPFIEQGLQEGKYGGEVIWFSKALEAFSALPNLTVQGDVVLLQNDWPDQYA
ncbi:MAG: UDP-N-acetylmuramoyl-tripeptide--D-alanyl-D-alanine ligase [bacterium]|nr:UDP-N-acetylmuramoyl-tripeptide--D-alanyl-D-alanine ligase [bacterium]